jgi:hypothetical protein
MGQASTGTAGTFLKSSSVTLGGGMRDQGSTTSPTTAISFDVLWTPLGIQTHDVLSAWTVYGQPVGRPWSPGRVRRPAKKARPISGSYRTARTPDSRGGSARLPGNEAPLLVVVSA